jgi:predicted metal-dependent phosphoesterase TrpH
MYQILHCHTKLSDGELSHRQILNLCAQKGISVIAFTDHDYLPENRIVGELGNWKNKKVNWIIGCELSSGLPKELGGKPTSNFHIVGLFVNPFYKNLNLHCRKIRRGRRLRMEQMVENMKKLGLKITIQDCLKQAQGETVGRAHIAAALEERKENKEVINGLIKKMAQASKHDLRARQKYKEMLRATKDQYPYKLFLSEDAFFNGVFVEHLYLKDMDETVDLIRKAGGLAILAHWTFSKEIVSLPLIEKFFKEKRLDGAEIVFGRPGINRGYEGIRRDMAAMARLTRKYGLIQAGGSDIHRRKEFDRFLGDKWFAGKTVGLIERIMKQRKLNLEWSSFKK